MLHKVDSACGPNGGLYVTDKNYRMQIYRLSSVGKTQEKMERAVLSGFERVGRPKQ
jgi:hypothetical protein